MCTTNLCIGFYILTFCVVGWFGALSLILIKSSREQGNTYVLDPLACWVNSEVVNPLNCFRSEVLVPLRKRLDLFARDFTREWNNHIESKTDIGRAF